MRGPPAFLRINLDKRSNKKGAHWYMHFLHRKIKLDARRALSGNWGKAVASTMLLGSICAFFYLLGKFFMKVLESTDTIDLLHVSAELRSGS